MAEETANVPMIRTTMRERAARRYSNEPARLAQTRSADAHQSVGQMNDSGLRQRRARIAR